jgi:membrane-associated protease RseP (regulator of RpoE activity)
MPFSLLGTLGAVINMKAPPVNRRQLLHIAAAGPLAGFVMALPILFFGLSISPVRPIGPGLLEGNSILYAMMKIAVFGRFLPDGRFDVYLSPMAFAGWTGLLVTALNLLPVGTLDGGHIIYALLGKRARTLRWPIVAALLLLGLLWDGWWLWAMLILFFGRHHAVPLDDITRLDGSSRIVAVATLMLFVLTFVPIPFTVVR